MQDLPHPRATSWCPGHPAGGAAAKPLLHLLHRWQRALRSRQDRSGLCGRGAHRRGSTGWIEPMCTELGLCPAWTAVCDCQLASSSLLLSASRSRGFEGCSAAEVRALLLPEPGRGMEGAAAGRTHALGSSWPSPIPLFLSSTPGSRGGARLSLQRPSTAKPRSPLRSLPAPQAKQYATASPLSRPFLKNKLINLPGATKTLSSWPLDVCGRSSRWRLKEFKVCFEKLFDSGRGSGAKRQRWGCKCRSPSAPAWVRERSGVGEGRGRAGLPWALQWELRDPCHLSPCHPVTLSACHPVTL